MKVSLRILTACALAVCSLTGMAQSKALKLAQKGIKVEPIRVAKAVASRDANGKLTWVRTGPWVAYTSGERIASSTDVAYDEYEFTDAVSVAPGDNPAYTGCATGGSRWFFGDGYLPGYRYNDMKCVAGANGKTSDRMAIGWYQEADALLDMQYFVTTTENFPDDVNGLDPNDASAAGRGDYAGVVASFGPLANGGGFYYYADIDLTGLGFGWTMPTDGAGGALQLFGDVDVNANTIAIVGQAMLWGVNPGNPTPACSDLQWDDDVTVDLALTPDELYSYAYGLCPDPLGAMVCFLYTPNTVTTETLAPTSEQILLGTNGSGGNLASWASNDGNNRTICKFFVPTATSPFIRANLNYTTTKANITALSFDVKVAVDAGGTQQITLNLQNKTTNAFVATSVVGQNTAANTTYSGVAAGTLNDYKNGSGAMTGQIEVKAVGFQTSAFPCIGFDSANMVVTG